jgi:LuxR family maltose regulon positive regulatory protein
MRTYERTLRLAVDHGAPELRGTADMHVGMAELHRERNDLDAARHHLSRSTEQGEHTGFPQNPYRWRVAMARIRMAERDLAGALNLLDEAERRYVSDFYPNVRPIAALRVRVCLAQGLVQDAVDWAGEQGLSAEDNLSYLREFAHITLAKVLIARFQTDREDHHIHQAINLLERLLEAAHAGERTGSAIDILIQQALAHEAHGDIPRALRPLERALVLAAPEGYVRIFVDEGDAMRNLLRHVAPSSPASSSARHLLRAFDESVQPSAAPPPISTTALAEPLTTRQIEILRLIAAGLRNQEIADRLFLSLPTVKRHIANAYGNLGVTHRTEAIARANELNLL